MEERARFGEVAAKAGHYESFYLKACRPDGGLGVWIRHTVHKRPGQEPTGSIWFTLFDRAAPAPRATKATVPASRLATPPGGWIGVGDAEIGPGEAAGSVDTEALTAAWSLHFDGSREPCRYLPADWLYEAPLPRTKFVAPFPDAVFSGRLEVDGEPISDQMIVGIAWLLMGGGFDTSTGVFAYVMRYLSENPEERRRLIEEPELMDTAVEEFLRAYAPVTMARLVAQDFQMDGCPMHQGDWVLLPFPAANRDPGVFPDADHVLIDRAENRHSAFGLGIHRCIGSTLARMEMRVALEEWLGKFPDFTLTPGAVVKWSMVTVRGPRQRHRPVRRRGAARRGRADRHVPDAPRA